MISKSIIIRAVERRAGPQGWDCHGAPLSKAEKPFLGYALSNAVEINAPETLEIVF